MGITLAINWFGIKFDSLAVWRYVTTSVINKVIVSSGQGRQEGLPSPGQVSTLCSRQFLNVSWLCSESDYNWSASMEHALTIKINSAKNSKLNSEWTKKIKMVFVPTITKLIYLLTKWEGRMGKYLARDHGVPTERSEVRAPWPRAKYFPIRPDLT